MRKATLMAAILYGSTLSAPASAPAHQEDRVVLTAVADPSGGLRINIKNNSDLALTAISIMQTAVGQAPSAVSRFDSAIKRWAGLPPGGQSEVVLQKSPTGGAPPQLLAAVFANGDVSGDATELKRILNERGSVLKALNLVLQHIPATPTAGLTKVQAADGLKQAQSAELASVADAALKAGIINVNLWLRRELQKMPEPADGAGYLTNATEKLRRWHDDLSSSRPSPL